MEKYIKQLLVSDSRAIIPGFGAIQALKEDDGYSLSFNKYLNFNDGKLVAAYAAGEGITEDEAKKFVEDFADVCKNKLQAGESIDIAGVGSFKNDADGDLVFAPVDVFDVSLPEANSAPEPEEAQAAEPEAVKAEGAPESEEVKTEDVSEPELGETSGYYDDEDEKKRRRIIVLVIILLLLLICGVLLFVVFKDNALYRAVFGSDKTKTEQVVEKPKTEKPKVEEPKAQPEVVEQPKAEPKQEVKAEPLQAVKLSKRYNIIVGAYQDEAPAIARVKALQDKGFSEAFVGINRKGKFLAVIGAFSNLAKAEAMQEEIVDGPYHIESWITNSGE